MGEKMTEAHNPEREWVGRERPGWVYQPAPGGGYISFPATAWPHIQWNHIDGPLLVMRNGELHWLTWRERFMFWLGWLTVEEVEEKYRPELRLLCAEAIDEAGRRALAGRE